MSFTPVVPFSGLAGYAFLQRTRPTQEAAFEAAPRLSRLTGHFLDQIGEVTTVEQLMEDRQLREVALGAFGLGTDIDSRFYVESVLSSDTGDDRSFANRLSDKRYLAMARAFGFADAKGPHTADEGFAERIVEAYKTQEFEIAVGGVDPSMRMALGLERELSQLVSRTTSEDARWFGVMAAPPLRKVFEGALGLPVSFGTLDIDRQLDEFRNRAERIFGVREVADFRYPERQQELIRRFLVRADLEAVVSSLTVPGSAALALLRGGG